MKTVYRARAFSFAITTDARLKPYLFSLCVESAVNHPERYATYELDVDGILKFTFAVRCLRLKPWLSNLFWALILAVNALIFVAPKDSETNDQNSGASDGTSFSHGN